MRTRIIERATGKEVADCRTTEAAQLIACRRGVANSDMLFVIGSEDNKLHKFASIMHARFCTLIMLHKHYGSRGVKVDMAPERRDLWRLIAGSREVRSPSITTNPLCESIGAELAADVELLVHIRDHHLVRVPGIDMGETWREAYQTGYTQSTRYRDVKFDLMIHEALGLLVIAPAEFVAGRENFVVRRSFGPRRLRL